MVRAYRNLNNGKITVQQKIEGRWLVVGHCDSLAVTTASFVVNESGRLRVIEEQQKNVHAFLVGYAFRVNNFKSFKGRTIKMEDATKEIRKKWAMCDSVSIKYNPYKFKTFVTLLSHEPIIAAPFASVNSHGFIIIKNYK
jgi:hypothetical protein